MRRQIRNKVRYSSGVRYLVVDGVIYIYLSKFLFKKIDFMIFSTILTLYYKNDFLLYLELLYRGALVTLKLRENCYSLNKRGY